jgi:hypothetical protein
VDIAIATLKHWTTLCACGQTNGFWRMERDHIRGGRRITCCRPTTTSPANRFREKAFSGLSSRWRRTAAAPMGRKEGNDCGSLKNRGVTAASPPGKGGRREGDALLITPSFCLLGIALINLLASASSAYAMPLPYVQSSLYDDSPPPAPRSLMPSAKRPHHKPAPDLSRE